MSLVSPTALPVEPPPPGVTASVPLAPLTTFGIGGPARWFARVTAESQLSTACAWAQRNAVPVFVLGGGSNILVADEGFPGLVLQIGLTGIGRQGNEFTVAAGEDWDRFVSHTVEADYAGVECLAGIPGTVGGSPVQNIGAYGQEVADTIQSVRCLEPAAQQFVEFPAEACGFAYRRSRFNHGPDLGRYIVTGVTFRLHPAGSPKLEYADLQKHCAGLGRTPTLAETAAAVRSIRARKGMVIPPGELAERDPDTRSAGSFFKNPVVSIGQFEQLLAAHPGMPSYPVPSPPGAEPQRKLAAAWLLEHAGFQRGFSVRPAAPAALSSRHTLALTNRSGGATAADILALRDVLVEGVMRVFGVRLEMEPIYVGGS